MEASENNKNNEQENPYDQAIASVRQAIAKFDGCTEAEVTALTRELEQLRSMAEKLECGRVEIVVFGEISTGKSALINALVGKAVAETNIRGGWTQDVWQLDWSGAGYRIPGLANSEIVLVDTPGLNEVDGETRTAMAEEAAARADLVLFVTDSDLNETEFTALSQLAATRKPLLLVINKKDLYTREQLADLFTHFESEKYRPLIDPQHLVAVASDPNEKEYILESPDGSARSEWRKPEPDIGALREKILGILDSEGKSLVALNAAIFAADTSDRMAALRVQLREGNANKVIWGYATAKAIAVAANPIPWADVLGGTTVDIAMVATLSKNLRFSTQQGECRHAYRLDHQSRRLGNGRRMDDASWGWRAQHADRRAWEACDKLAARGRRWLRFVHRWPSIALLFSTRCKLGRSLAETNCRPNFRKHR